MSWDDLRKFDILKALAAGFLALLVWNATEMDRRLKCVERNQIAIMVHMGVLPGGHKCQEDTAKSGGFRILGTSPGESRESKKGKIPPG